MPLTLLVVDDNEVDRMLVRRLLRGNDLVGRIEEAGDLAAARARLSEGDIDVILLDHLLPDGDARDLLALLGEDDPPAVVLTGQGDERLAAALIRAGAADYLVKGDLNREGLARTLALAHRRAQAERLRRDAEAALARAHREALEAARMKNEFLANMSHEIRTPMNGLLGMLTLLRDTPLDDEQRRYLDDAIASGEHLMALLNDILDLSKLEAGKFTLEPLPFHPGEVLGHAVRRYAPQAHGKGVSLWLHLAPELPRGLEGDGRRLQQIVANLVNNAVKFTEQGRILVSAHWRRGRLELTVEDSGVGIAAEDLERIFRPFDQADAAITRLHGGSGLGLSIVHHLVRLMDGQVTVDSAPGRGSRFTVTLPLQVVDPRPLVSPDETALTLHLVSARREVRDSFSAWCRARGWRLQCHDPQAPPAEVPVLWDLWAGQEPPPATPCLRLVPLGAAGGGRGALYAPCLIPECLDELATRLQRARPCAPPRVLVVEDEDGNRRVAEAMLTRLGCRVHSLHDGTAVVQAVERHGPFRLVLMDCQLPIVDGLEATRRLRRWERETGRAPVPVVGVTAHPDEAHRTACLEAGMDDFLEKPLRLDTLKRTLARWLEPR